MISHIKTSKSCEPPDAACKARLASSRGSAFLRLAASIPVIGLCVFGAPTVASAQAESAQAAITSYESDVRVNRNGTLSVSETWKGFGDGGTFSRHLVTREHYADDVDHVVNISDVKATAGNQNANVGIRTEGDITTISVSGLSGSTPVQISYRVDGAVASTPTGTELRWVAVHDMPKVERATVMLNSPELAYVRCSAGPLSSQHPCTLSQITESVPIMEQRNLAAGHSMSIVTGYAAGQVAASTNIEYRKSLRRAFLADPLHLGVTAGILLLGGAALLGLYYRRGRDPIDPARVVPASLFDRSNGMIVFNPPQGLRPGEIGTLMDERVDPVDVTSTILDLAVRGHIHITELPKHSEFARADWLLTLASAPPDRPETYEERLLAGIFGGGNQVKVSEIGPRVREQLGAVQDALYDEVVAHGWFTERPDRARNRWSTTGIVVFVGGIVLTVALALLTTWGLPGLAVTALGAGLMVLGGHMPSKAPEAGRVVGQVASLRGELLELNLAELPANRHVELCSRALPYAVVLGGADRWIDALVATDESDAPDQGFPWYRGPANWHLQYLPDSLKNFTTSLTGALFAR